MANFEQPWSVYAVGDIDSRTTGTTDLPALEVETAGDSRCVPILVTVNVEQQIGSVTTPATISLGTNGPAYDNLMPATALTGLDGQQIGRPFLLTTPGITRANGVVIKVNVSVGASITGATPVQQIHVKLLCIQCTTGI